DPWPRQAPRPHYNARLRQRPQSTPQRQERTYEAVPDALAVVPAVAAAPFRGAHVAPFRAVAGLLARRRRPAGPAALTRRRRSAAEAASSQRSGRISLRRVGFAADHFSALPHGRSAHAVPARDAVSGSDGQL